jgi:hypothetical protein
MCRKVSNTQTHTRAHRPVIPSTSLYLQGGQQNAQKGTGLCCVCLKTPTPPPLLPARSRPSAQAHTATVPSIDRHSRGRANFGPQVGDAR